MFLAPHHRAVSAPPGDNIIRDGLITRYPMDEGTGLILNDDQGSNNADLFGIVQDDWVPGFQGSAVHFSDNSKYGVNNTLELSNLDEWTVMVRFKTDVFLSNMDLIRYNDASDDSNILGIMFRTTTSIRLKYRLASGGSSYLTVQTGTPIDDNLWHTVHFIWDTVNLVGCYDGVMGSPRGNNQRVWDAASDYVVIGRDTLTGTDSPRAVLDDIRFYNRGLSGAECLQIHQGNG